MGVSIVMDGYLNGWFLWQGKSHGKWSWFKGTPDRQFMLDQRFVGDPGDPGFWAPPLQAFPCRPPEHNEHRTIPKSSLQCCIKIMFHGSLSLSELSLSLLWLYMIIQCICEYKNNYSPDNIYNVLYYHYPSKIENNYFPDGLLMISSPVRYSHNLSASFCWMLHTIISIVLNHCYNHYYHRCSYLCYHYEHLHAYYHYYHYHIFSSIKHISYTYHIHSVYFEGCINIYLQKHISYTDYIL